MEKKFNRLPKGSLTLRALFTENVSEMATHRKAEKVDPNKYKVLAVHLWDSLMSGVKVAVFVPVTNPETGEKEWKIYAKQPVMMAAESSFQKPEVAYLQGAGAKEFLRQHGYRIDRQTKNIKPLTEEEDTDGGYVHMIDLDMAIMSHLSDLQEMVPSQQKYINFIKAMLLEYKKGVKQMSENDLNALYDKWVSKK